MLIYYSDYIRKHLLNTRRGNFLDVWATISFLRLTLLRQFSHINFDDTRPVIVKKLLLSVALEFSIIHAAVTKKTQEYSKSQRKKI
jgi:hypothetical protein